MNTPTSTGRYAATHNMTLACETLYQAIDAPEGVDRMVVFYGPVGYGKSIAVTHAANKTDAVYVELKSVWTVKSFLTTLARELGLSHIERTTQAILDQVIAALNENPRPLIIDETDFMITRGSPEILRDIYRATRVPLMMVGEPGFPARIKQWERFESRILTSVEAQPATPADVLLLRDLYCKKIRVADDLAIHIGKQCKGTARRIVTHLQNAQTLAVNELSDSIDLAAYLALTGA